MGGFVIERLVASFGLRPLELFFLLGPVLCDSGSHLPSLEMGIWAGGRTQFLSAELFLDRAG